MEEIADALLMSDTATSEADVQNIVKRLDKDFSGEVLLTIKSKLVYF